jgi:uncharacterized protein (TIGR03000 family)
MYSLVLMMALGNGATTPSVIATEPANVTSYSHTLNRGCRGGGRGGRHGCHRCHGCSGCYCYGCYGCGCYSCHGCYGCYGGYGYGGYAGYGSYAIPVATARTEAAATIIVSLPADAMLTVDDQMTRSTSERRTFTSPPLQSGEVYYYTLKAEITRDGKPITAAKRVTVQAGKETEVRFDFDTASVAAR